MKKIFAFFFVLVLAFAFASADTFFAPSGASVTAAVKGQLVKISWAGFGSDIAYIEQYRTNISDGRGWILRFVPSGNSVVINVKNGDRFQLINRKGEYLFISPEMKVSKHPALRLSGVTIDFSCKECGATLQVSECVNPDVSYVRSEAKGEVKNIPPPRVEESEARNYEPEPTPTPVPRVTEPQAYQPRPAAPAPAPASRSAVEIIPGKSKPGRYFPLAGPNGGPVETKNKLAGDSTDQTPVPVVGKGKISGDNDDDTPVPIKGDLTGKFDLNNPWVIICLVIITIAFVAMAIAACVSVFRKKPTAQTKSPTPPSQS